MKSPMIKNADYLPEKGAYSELQILSSAAGFYVGTTYTDPKYGCEEPGSRDSDYFRTYQDAERYLKTLNIIGDETAAMLLRQNP